MHQTQNLSEYLFEDPLSFVEVPRFGESKIIKNNESYAAVPDDADLQLTPRFPANQTAKKQTFCHHHL